MTPKRKLVVMGIFSALFGCQQKTAETPALNQEEYRVTAQLNHFLRPLDRGSRYEDPLQEALAQQGLGEVTGGGTMQRESGEIEYIDVEISLTDLEAGAPFVISRLEEAGAPKGSLLKWHDGSKFVTVPFGKREGLGIYLDGVNLPDEVYKTSNVNTVIEELNRRINGHGELQGYWQGNTETALYFYGDNAQEMAVSMKDFLDKDPLCQGSRVVTIAPKEQ
ncbi:hypothetical protein [Planctomicrobium piriforme]|uniref:Lipoprotein n=1 Tax=Planctomicrobium piriforme TaxID=1576369 RepID=A0A1I3B1H8_9PLAN|nr:hypothetical protein [Planctomicrobium piriforme]SFH56123.1 hypothetical protein SAMN05421753_101173 [Planctomicrobium piriforme]